MFIHADMYCQMKQRDLECFSLSPDDMAHAIANCEEIGREQGAMWYRFYAQSRAAA